MPINDARRIAAVGWRFYANANHITEDDAKALYAEAKSVCDDADAFRAVSILKSIAEKRGMAVEELIAAYE